MKTIKYNLGEKYDTRECVVALGFFDGVHLGHRELLKFTVSEARRLGVASAVFTFAYGGGIKADSPKIYSDREREELFSSLGIDVCFVADFASLSGVCAEDFIRRCIREDIGAVCAVAGYNFRFGQGGLGDASQLSRLMEETGGRARIFEPFLADGSPVSSTRVRALMQEGRIEAASRLLGTPYFLVGRVEHGRADGRTLGFPTLNVSVSEQRSHLRQGVYLTSVEIDGKFYTGLTNVGECPSFGRREYHTETFLLDFDKEVYGMETKVYFLSFLRDEQKFSSPEDFKKQIERDCELARKRITESPSIREWR